MKARHMFDIVHGPLPLRWSSRFALLLHVTNIVLLLGLLRTAHEENRVMGQRDSKHRRREMFIPCLPNKYSSSVRSDTASCYCRQADLILLYQVLVARVGRFTSVRHGPHHQRCSGHCIPCNKNTRNRRRIIPVGLDVSPFIESHV